LWEVPTSGGYKILDRRYVLYDVLGQGGMGIVFKGRHAELEIDVAVKVLDPKLARAGSSFVERFKKEARAAARIHHPNVVQVIDVGECAGLHFLVMEFVPGEDGRKWVKRRGALAIHEACSIALGMTRGLAAAHRAGLVHRDMKPDNVLIGMDGTVKIADLGLVKQLEGDGLGEGMSELTVSGATLGTPRYMPPEQFENTKHVGPTADVYALGATLFYFLTNHDGVAPGTVAQVSERVRTEPFPSVLVIRPDVPAELAALIAECTDRDPARRPQDADEVTRRLEAFDYTTTPLASRVSGDPTPKGEVHAPPPANLLATIRMSLTTPESADEPEVDSGRTFRLRPASSESPEEVKLEAARRAARAVELFESDRLEEALYAFRKALELNPLSAAAHFNQARVLTRLGRTHAANQAYRRAHELDPSLGEPNRAVSNRRKHRVLIVLVAVLVTLVVVLTTFIVGLAAGWFG